MDYELEKKSEWINPKISYKNKWGEGCSYYDLDDITVPDFQTDIDIQAYSFNKYIKESKIRYDIGYS